jgi:hypothetical protein
MIRPEQWINIKDLHRQGLSQRQIGRLTRHSRNTIAKTLNQRTWEPFARKPWRWQVNLVKSCLVERYQDYDHGKQSNNLLLRRRKCRLDNKPVPCFHVEGGSIQFSLAISPESVNLDNRYRPGIYPACAEAFARVQPNTGA